MSSASHTPILTLADEDHADWLLQHYESAERVIVDGSFILHWILAARTDLAEELLLLEPTSPDQVESFVKKVTAAMIEKLELEAVNESIRKKVFFVFEKRDEGNKGRSKKPSKLNEAIRILYLEKNGNKAIAVCLHCIQLIVLEWNRLQGCGPQSRCGFHWSPKYLYHICTLQEDQARL